MPAEHRDDLGPSVRNMIERLAISCVAVAVGPVINGFPGLFVAQVTFAEVAPLAGFPRSGLLQSFVADDDTWGLTFDDRAGQDIFTVRWFADTSAPSVTDAVPSPRPGNYPPIEAGATPASRTCSAIRLSWPPDSCGHCAITGTAADPICAVSEQYSVELGPGVTVGSWTT